MNALTSQTTIGKVSSIGALHRFNRDEEGAAYTLSYVMVIPFYALFICMVIETALFMTAKLGTVYSAYAAARTASVWSSATTWEKTQKKAKEAAFRAMTPFASGTNPTIRDAGSVTAFPEAAGYGLAYKRFAKDPVANSYLLAKYSYARQHVKVKFEGPPKTWKSEIKVQVTYEFPFNVPGVGRLFGTYHPVDQKYYYKITSQAILSNEGPKDGRKTIGIGYGTLE
jgi:hypothetical protein